MTDNLPNRSINVKKECPEFRTLLFDGIGKCV